MVVPLKGRGAAVSASRHKRKGTQKNDRMEEQR
nr:MAG TPA: hypothetical protein [Bacteriophage sp.]